MDIPDNFGEWLKRRRKGLDLTQNELAVRASCTVFTLRKIEAGLRRPSKQLAGILAGQLEIPADHQTTFVRVARGELCTERLFPPERMLSRGSLSEGKKVSVLGNLPRELTPFIGRGSELAALNQLLSDPGCSLLTLIGPGGIGKTRLAVEAAHQCKQHFPDGVWFVPLVALNSPVQIVPAIASVLDFKFKGPTEPLAQLSTYLREKQALLVLDNVEHLLDGVSVFTQILKDCPQLKLLVTSRERLNLLSEWLFEIQGLPVPPNDQGEQFESFSSVALFVQSARRVRAGFEIQDADRKWVLKICQFIEGMPLCIELSAAWVGLLSCEEIAKEIEKSIDFLSANMRDLPERHRSVRVVFDHSWQMLSTEEQQVLSQLSAFRGGFNRETAEQVAGLSLPILSTLVNRTLLRRAAPARYEMHELVRQYCATHLAADPQTCAAVQKRHYDSFLALAETAQSGLKRGDQLEWLEKLEQERDNLRVALEWALESDRATSGADELALRLSGVLSSFWWLRGYLHEGHLWLMKSLQQNPERCTITRAAALLAYTSFLYVLGCIGAAYQPSEESVAIYRELGDQRGLAEALRLSGAVLLCLGKASLGLARLEQALAICRKIGDRWMEGRLLFSLGIFLSDHACDPAGRAMLEESAAIFGNLGDKHMLNNIQISLGVADIGLGDYAGALRRLEHELSVARELRYSVAIADSLNCLAWVYRILGQYSTAQSYLEQALDVYQDLNSIWETDILCALVENAIFQRDLTTAKIYIQRATNYPGISEDTWHQALIDYYRALLMYYQGDITAAMIVLENVIVLSREGQYKPHLARSLVALGRVKRTLGEIAQATDLLLEGLDLFRALDRKLGIANALEELSAVYSFQGASLQAAMLLGTAHTLREMLGAPLPPVDHAAYESVLIACRTQLGEAGFSRARDAGKALSLDQAFEIARDKENSPAILACLNPL